MNIEIENINDPTFPRLMIGILNPSTVVLMVKPECGLILKSGTPRLKAGTFESNWKMDDFRDFTGKITLSN
jgi:hypothetical protein